MKRGTLASEREGGRLYVLLEHDPTTEPGRTHDREHERTNELIATLQAQLQAERQAHAEAKRIIAGLVERLPQLEAPADAPQGPESATEQQEGAEPRPDASGIQEGTRKPWWQFWR